MQFSTVVLALTVAASSATAQSPATPGSPIDSGSRIRVLSPILSQNREVGKLVSLTPDTLLFRIAKRPETTAIPIGAVTRLEVSNGTHQTKMKSALIGLFVGAAAGAALGAATYHPAKCEAACFDFGAGFDAAVVGILGGLAGGITGLIMGSRERDTWVPVTVPRP